MSTLVAVSAVGRLMAWPPTDSTGLNSRAACLALLMSVGVTFLPWLSKVA